MKLNDILGLNARAALFTYQYNKPSHKDVADEKLRTKYVLKKAGVPVPAIFAKFVKPRDVFNFDFNRLPDSFALKPNKGMGGEGIIVVKKRFREKIESTFSRRISHFNPEPVWITTQKERVSASDLKLHILDILEGAYSLNNEPDKAYIEEYVGRHKAFRKYAYRGTPDLRIIVFNKVPVMAMLRLPTKESGGRANLHQGAIGVGVDMATGITTRAYWHGEYIRFKPDSNRKLHGIKIPFWTKVLETASNCQVATGIGYLGVDCVLHPEKGPMVLELNYQPGLGIQLANAAGLRHRLERVKNLDVKDAEHGVKIAKIIFAERFSDRVKAEEGIKILKPIERIKIYPPDKKAIWIDARIDTGAVRSSIDKKLAEELGLLDEKNILWRRHYAYRSAHGRQSRPVVALTLRLAGRKMKTSASIANRSRLTTHLLIGRNDLTGYLVNPTEE